MQDHTTPRETAEEAIAAALHALPIDDAMAALIEMQALILADLGILPGTAEFDRLAIAYLARLAERVHNMRGAMLAAAH